MSDPATPDEPRLLLIDGHALAYRAFHALPQTMTATDGEPTNASFGFATMLLEVLDAFRPSHIAVAFDAGRSGRDEIYPEYKATRAEMDDSLRLQMDRIREIVASLGIPEYRAEGWEADDVIATLADQARDEGVDTLVVTGDTDLFQLVRPGVRVVTSGRRFGDTIIYDEARVEDRYGVTPAQLVEWKGLKGDSSDNIPGVPGIGDKGASAIVKAFGSVESAIERVEEVTPTRARNSLRDNAEQARLSVRLVRIRHDAPVRLELERARFGDFDREAVVELFRRLDFRSLADRIPGVPGEEQAQASSEPEGEYRIVATMEELGDLVARMEGPRRVAFDTETTSTDAMRARLVGLALSDETGRGWYVPIGHVAPPAPAGATQAALPGTEPEPAPEDEAEGSQGEDGDGQPANLPLEAVLEAVRPLLEGPTPKVAHHAKYDALVMRRQGVELGGPLFDTMLAAWIVRPGSRGYGLKELAWSRLGVEMTPIQELIGRGKKQITMAEVPAADAGRYAAADVDMTLRLAEQLDPELDERDQRALFEDLEMPVSAVLTDMEEAGIRVDTGVLDVIRAELDKRADALSEEIYEIAGHSFNIGSPQQLGEVLFGELGLPATRKTQTGWSTSASALAGLELEYPIVASVLAWRHVSKLRGTYVDALPELINPETGRIHTSWHQTGAVTGRLSSSDPNLQNIPVRTELGGQIRRAFVADPGQVLLAADYSQVELRILAALSGDPTLREVFATGGDVHAATAAYLFDKEPADVNAEERRVAKTVNFGTVYGISAFGLASRIGMSRSEAQDFIDRYFERYGAVRAYFDRVLESAAETGYVETLFGRRRYFPELLEGARVDHQSRARAEREAINAPLQGSAADITKRAMIDLHRGLAERGLRARLLLQVHDELVLEAPEDELEEVARLTRDRMVGAAELDGVALEADVSTGPSWADLSPYALATG